MNASTSRCISQCATFCSMYCSVMPLKIARLGSSWKKQAEMPILSMAGNWRRASAGKVARLERDRRAVRRTVGGVVPRVAVARQRRLPIGHALRGHHAAPASRASAW